jgi:hypothetical protein
VADAIGMTRVAALLVLLLSIPGCAAAPRYAYVGRGDPPEPFAQAQSRCTAYGPISPAYSAGAADSLRRSSGDTFATQQADQVNIDNCLRAAGWQRQTAP